MQLTLHAMYHRRAQEMDWSQELKELNFRLKRPVLPLFILEPEIVEVDKQAELNDKITAFCQQMKLQDPGMSIWLEEYVTKPVCLQ